MAAAGGTDIIATFLGPPAVRISRAQVQAALAAAGVTHIGDAARDAVAGLLPPGSGGAGRSMHLAVLPAALVAGVDLTTQPLVVKTALCTAILKACGVLTHNERRSQDAKDVMASVSASLKGTGWA